MKRRKVAMLMAVLMTASSLSGSYVSAASIEDMEVTAEEMAAVPYGGIGFMGIEVDFIVS